MIKIIFPIIFFCCLLALPGRAQPASCIFNGKGVRVQLVSDPTERVSFPSKCLDTSRDVWAQRDGPAEDDSL